VDSVGPKAGAELRKQGIVSVVAAISLIVLYVAFRFDLIFAPGAILSLLHDASVCAGFFVLSRREFDLSMIGVILTILGYSINDTIVTFDRIRENQQKFRRTDLPALINTAINETLGRTLATTFTVFIAITPFLFLGTGSIKTFALAMCVGLVTGAYSTIYIAAPAMLFMQDAKPWFLRLIKASQRGSPEQAAGVGKEQRRLGRLRDEAPPEKGTPESERDLFKRV
jgi:preprotein translocase subunit SecF